MALTAGAGPHFAWIIVNGGTFPVEHGSVEQHKTRKTSTFSAVVPMFYPGAEAAFANLGDNEVRIAMGCCNNKSRCLTLSFGLFRQFARFAYSLRWKR